MDVLYLNKKQESKDIFTFYFESDIKLNYTPGQFIEIFIPHKNSDSRGTSRYFTISSSPNDKFFSITTRVTSESSSFKKTLLNLDSKTNLKILPPMGDFVTPKLLQTKLIFIAGGIGITPYLSMIKFINQTKENRLINLFYAVKTEDEIINPDLLNKSNINTTIIVENPSEFWGGEMGLLTVPMINDIAKPDQNSLIYISGPDGLVKKISVDLKNLNLTENQIITDFFPGY